MDSLFTILESNNKAMGSITLTKNGKVLYSRAIGFANTAGKKTANTPSTKYRVGSVTKTFTSVMIQQLIEEKKLTFSTPLAQFYPQMPNAQAITIDHLLYHRSGLHDFTHDVDYAGFMATVQTKEQMLERLAKLKPDFMPDEKSAYCNTNYVLLGYIIEEVTKKSYQQNLTARITQKVGLQSTFYGGKIDLGKGEASSYEYKNGTWALATETDMSIPHGAGAIVSTSNDLAKFIQALFTNKLLTKESLQAMTVRKDNFGRGILRFPVNNDYGYWHNGAIDGFRSLISYIPQDSVAITFICNGLNGLTFSDIWMGALSIYYNQPYTLPSFPPTITLTNLSGYEGFYTSKQNPLKITIKQENGYLVGQAAGQPTFVLEAKSETDFHISQVGAILEFSKAGSATFNQFTLKQNGAQFLFEKQ